MPLVHRRERKHADIVDHLRHAREMFYGSPSVILYHRVRNGAAQGDNSVIDRVTEVVKHGVIREHYQLVAHLPRQILSGRIPCARKQRNRNRQRRRQSNISELFFSYASLIQYI